MADATIPDLALRSLPYGTHATVFNLLSLIYLGGAAQRISTVASKINQGQLGPPLTNRVPLAMKLHEVMDGIGARGGAPATLREHMYNLRYFYSWADDFAGDVTENNVQAEFKRWTEHLICCVQSNKLTAAGAYARAVSVATMLDRALGLRAGVMIRSTRLRAPKSKQKRALPPATAKQNLELTFQFGHAITALCDGLSATAIRGPIPLKILLPGGQQVTLACGLVKPSVAIDAYHGPASAREKFLRPRAALALDAPLDARAPLINTRIQAELLLFCAQTSMNLSQVTNLRRTKFSYQTDGEDMVAKAYKARRGGQVVFRAFRLYKEHFKRYLGWLDALFPGSDDDRLFPIFYRSRLPAIGTPPQFKSIQEFCRSAGIRFIPPRALRSTRVNWLLRRSRDAELTAEMSGHLKRTLLDVYEEPHFQSAAAEIAHFHCATDPSIAPPGPGLCVDLARTPAPVLDAPAEAPKPDCISPDGCLFCRHHRDVLSFDYCWKLASHRHIKLIELAGYRPPKRQPARHPAQVVIDRIGAKLSAISDGSPARAQWVCDACDAIRAGRFHPAWDGFIQLLENLE